MHVHGADRRVIRLNGNSDLFVLLTFIHLEGNVLKEERKRLERLENEIVVLRYDREVIWVHRLATLSLPVLPLTFNIVN